MKDRRSRPRFKLDIEVNSGTNIGASVKNLAVGGICIITDQPLQKGNTINLVLTMPDASKITVKAYVLWSLEMDRSHYENGLDFRIISIRDVRSLKKFLN
ncbi:MAG: PilZ domain-containing protein [Spirochaetales bacterium]|nr:PilZ domain-containing protein [Spirochaetales bacterium]